MDFFGQVIDGVNWILQWLNSGIYGFVEEAFKELTAWFVVMKIKTMIFMLHFSWGVASTIMENLNLGSYINSAFSSLDSRLMSYITCCRVPESLNLILQAIITRITLSIIGW